MVPTSLSKSNINETRIRIVGWIQRAKLMAKSIKSQKKESLKLRKRKRKHNIKTVDCSKKAKRSYGEAVLDDSPDMSDEQLLEMTHTFMEKQVMKVDELMTNIEEQSHGQVTSELWHRERENVG